MVACIIYLSVFIFKIVSAAPEKDLCFFYARDRLVAITLMAHRTVASSIPKNTLATYEYYFKSHWLFINQLYIGQFTLLS